MHEKLGESFEIVEFRHNLTEIIKFNRSKTRFTLRIPNVKNLKLKRTKEHFSEFKTSKLNLMK